MDRRRAAGVLLALAACFACSAAAPTASNQTALDLYEGAPEGCYYNFQHYGEGDRIMTNEPCLNCTCHNRMLMCYLRVCPFTKPIGQDCTVEKRADQCCPIVTCPDVPVDLLTSTSTTSPAEYGATGVGKVDKYGCSISGKYFPEGSKVPPTPNKPCEHCYCIRNMTTCVMQECTLHVDGCTPIYHKDVCCPVRYSCDHPEDEIPLLDDMSTTVRPTPGFLLTTTTVAPVTQMTQDCVHDDQIFSDGTSIKTEKPCEHCYCMKGDIVCVVQECGTPMENEGKNCTSLPPRDGQCCPDTYICEGDVPSTESFAESTTELGLEKLTTLSPPMRGGVEGSGYRNEPDEVPYTASPTESEIEGSGDDHDIPKPVVKEPMKSDKPTNIEDSASATETPLLEEHTTSTEFNKQIMEEGTDEPQLFTTVTPLKEDAEKLTTSELMEEEALQPHGHVSTTSDNSEESYERATTEYIEPLPTTSDVTDKQDSKPHEYGPSTVGDTKYEESENTEPQEDPNVKSTKSQYEYMTTEPSKPDSLTTIATYDTFDKTTRSPVETDNEADIGITSIPDAEVSSINKYADEVGSDDIEKDVYSTTSIPEQDIITTELDHAQNTVAVAEDESTHPYAHVPSTVAPLSENETETAMVEKESHEEVPTTAISIEDIGMITTEPDRGLNTIPNEINAESSEPSLVDKTIEVKSTESSLPESSTLVPDSLVTKGDQYTITTEPSFRKEDESSVSTHKPKDTSTVKPEFEDEGLIPTEEHSDKTITGSETPYEDITTSIPEYAGITETKQPSSESAMQPLDSSVTLPENIADVTPKPEDELTLSTEKITDITPTISEDVTTHEEPSRIPGEGDCLLDGITYKNNSIVPSTNKCHSSCRCTSSIIKCDPIICSPPPNYMGNCESIYDPLDSCCPTYVCDHPRETIPPQSDNQMSGTESPVPPPTIECRGDQCEIIPPEKHHDENICGPDGCGDDIQKPVAVEPSPEQPVECVGGQCRPSNVGCPNGDCSTVDAQETPVQLCTGEHCINDVSPEVPETSAPTIESTDCVGESCKQGDCGPNGCDSNVISNPEDAHIECSIDKPCRRKEPSPVAESAPCKGAECEKTSVNEVEEVTRHPESHETTEQSVKEITQSILDMTETPDQQQDISSEKKEQLPVSEMSTTLMPGTEQENTVPVEEIFTESYVTEHEDTQTESVIKEIVTEKPSDDEIEQTSDDKESTESPTIVAHQEHDINKPAVLEEQSTVNPVVEIENNEIKPIVTDKQEKDTPAVTDYNTTEKPNLLDEDQPSIAENDGQDPSSTSEKEGTENPLESTEESITIKPTAAYDVNEKESEISPEKDSTISTGEEFMQYSTKSPEEEKVNDESTEFEQVATDKTIVQEESTDTPTLNTDEGKEEPSNVEEKGTEKPISTDMYAPEEKPEETPSDTDKIEEPLKDINEETEIPTEKYEESERPTTISQESTEKSTLSGEDGQQIPMGNSEQAPDKATSIEEDSLLIPVDVKEKPTITPEDVMEGETEPPTDEAYNGTPTSVITEGEGTEGPINQPEDDKVKPSTADKEYPEKPTVIDEENKELTPVTEGAITEKTIVADDETKEPAEPSSTEKPNDVIPEENTITDDGHKLKPVDINVDITETPTDIEKEGTETTVVSEEENKLKPIEEGEEVTSKPSEVEEEKPISNEDDIKLTSIEQIETTTHGEREDFTKDDNELQPIDDHKESSRKPSIDEESTGKPAVTADAGEEKPSSYDSDTEKPIIVEVEYKPTEHAEDGTEQPTIGEIGTEKPMVSEDDNKIPMYESEITTETPTKSGVEGTEHPVIIGDENEIMPSDITDETTKIPTTSEVKDSEKPIDAKGEDEMKPTNVGTDRPTTVQEQPSFIDDTRRKEPSAIGDEDELTPVSLDEERTEGSISIEMEGTPKPDTEDESKLTPIGVSEEQSTEEPSNIVPSDEESKLKPSDAEDEVTEKPIVNEENNTATPNIIEDESHDKPFGTEGEGSEKPSVILDENIDKPTDVEEEPTEKPAVTDVKEPFDQKASTESSIAEDVNKDMPSGIEEGVKDKIEIPEEETKKPPTDYESSTEKPSEEESKEKPTGAEEEITVTPVTTEETNKPADVEEEGSPMIIDEDVNEKPAISSDDQIKYPDDIDSEKPDEVTTEPKPVGELQPEIQTEKYVPETLEEGSGMELQTPEHETVKPAESTETESQNETKPPYHEVSTKSSVETTSSELPAEEIVTSPASHQMEFESTTKFTETVETVTKSSESSEITEQEEPMAHTQIYESDSPSLSESGTTLMEPHEDNISTKSPVTESESGEIDRKTTSELPEQSLVTEKSPESFEDDLHSTGSPEVHDIESGITVTQVPIRTDEEEIKTDNTEAFIPEKESTESPVSSVTEPVRSFTEFKESSVTEQEQMVTEYPEKVTESQESAAIEKDNGITAIPPDTLGAETEKDVAEHFESHTTRMPVTESQETSHTTTVPLEVYTNKEVAGTEIPLSHVTDSQNTQTKLEGLEITETPEIPTSGDEATVDDTHKYSTESVSLDDMQTELPNALITSEAPQSLITDHDIKQTEIPQEPESVTTKTEEGTRAPETYITEQEKIQTEDSAHVTEPAQSITSEQDEKLTKVPEDLPTESQYTVPSLHETQTEAVTSSLEVSTTLPERTTESLADEQATEVSSSQSDYSETTPYLIELEEHTHKMADESSTPSPFEEDHATTNPDRKQGDQVSDATTEKMSEIEVETKKPEVASSPIDHSTVGADAVTTVSSYKPEDTASASETEPQKSTSAPEVTSFTEKEAMEVEKEEPMYSTPKVTTAKQEEEPQAPVDDRFGKPEEKPSETSEILPPGTTAEVPKPGISDMQPTDEMPAPEEDGHFPPSGSSGYGEPDYAEEDQAFGPGTCRYGGKVYVSAQQIPRDDPCDFCFCFRSDIICLQQSCPPPIHGCHEEPIQGFCCPRYECPVSMATTVNVTTTTTTTTTTLPPHFPTHSYKGAAQRRGCQIKGHSYKVGEVVRSSSGPCLHCTCGGDGQMKCDPKACTPEPMLRQMIAAAVSAKRRR